MEQVTQMKMSQTHNTRIKGNNNTIHVSAYKTRKIKFKSRKGSNPNVNSNKSFVKIKHVHDCMIQMQGKRK